MTTDKRNDTMRRVQGLIDKANSTEFPEERDALLARADALMTKYAIEQFELDATRPRTEREEPVVVDITMPTARTHDVQVALDSMFGALCHHCEVRFGQTTNYGASERTVRVVGYANDVRYLEMLFLSVQMHLVTTIEPRVDPTKTEVENYAALREAGIPVERILPMLGYDYFLANRTVLGRFRRQYAKLCESQGRKPIKGLTGEAYRDAFMGGYASRMRARLGEMATERQTAGAGHELAIVGRADAVREKLWETYPERRPHPADCDCDRCHRCKDEACVRPNCVASRQKYKPLPKSAFRTLRFDSRAYAAGSKSANEADLSRGNVGTGNAGELGR